MAAVARGDLAGALESNVASPLVALGVAALAVATSLELVTGRALVARAWRIERVRIATLVVVIVVMAVAWGVNLVRYAS